MAELSQKYQAIDYDEISQKEKAQVFTFLTLKAVNDDALMLTKCLLHLQLLQ